MAMSKNICTILLLPLILFVCSTSQTNSPESQKNYVEVSKKTLGVGCYTSQEKLPRGHFPPSGSRFARSDILVSPNGMLRTYTEAQALLADPNDVRGCKNRSRLLLGGQDSEEFSLVLALEPKDGQDGNGMRVVDWSQDSRFLLLDWMRWYYGSHWDTPQIMVFDVQERRFIRPDVVEIFRRRTGNYCHIVVYALGFTRDNKVALRVFPDAEYERTPCVDKPGNWLLDANNETLEQMPDEFKPKKYGRFEEQPLPE